MQRSKKNSEFFPQVEEEASAAIPGAGRSQLSALSRLSAVDPGGAEDAPAVATC